MDDESDKIIEGKPAAYPHTSTAESDSRNIFQDLLNPQFIKGDIRVMDKIPNSDGILEITDQENYPIGKIDIQLKTLSKSNYSNPKYQCKRSFFAYCRTNALPVFMVVVNREDRKAYWRHIDAATLKEVKENMKGDSYMLSISIQNCIDKQDEKYITEWSLKAKEAWEKYWMFDSLELRKKELEEKLTELHSKLQNPVNLPSYALKEIHKFLDEYNYIIDKEFGSVKLVLYPDYWKIGMGIIRYQFGDVRFILYPVEYDKSQLLIKEVDPSYDYLGKEMMQGNVLMWTGMENTESIATYPIPYAYKLLEDSILGITGTYNFPLADLFLANEYVISFIDRYHQYLNLEQGKPTYSLKDLKYMLYNVIPMLAATNHTFADWVIKHNHDIDSYDTFRAYENHRKRIEEAIKKIKQGFQPKVSVTVTSERYNIDLVHYYISLLEKKGIEVATRQYQLNQRNEEMYGVDLWRTWNKEPLSQNLKFFFQNFYRLYEAYITTHFPYISHYLNIIKNKEITLVHVFHFDDLYLGRPQMEVYHLRPEIAETGSVFCYLAEDPDNPIDREKYFSDRQLDCQINGKKYHMVRMHGQPLEFMFTDSPIYTLIKERLKEKMKDLFNKKKKNDYNSPSSAKE